MSVGPVGGLAGSVAGTPLAQTAGSDVERAQQATSNQERLVQTELRAERAGGIGEADGDDHETAERDADGRRPWEAPSTTPPAGRSQPSAEGPQSKDASRQSGNLVDLTG
jgi:hypothetical protein